MTGLTATVVGPDALASSVRTAGVLVLDAARIPYRTGRLASTARALVDDQSVDLVAGGAVAPYAPAVHARDPFLSRALDDVETALLDLYTDHAADAVDGIQGA